MAFLDKKEQVIEIKLTKYGEHLLSHGNFKPVYYAFFDRNILYDSLYGGVSEEQNDTIDRIKDVPSSNVQYMFAGAETNIKKVNKLIRTKKEELGSEKTQPEYDKYFFLPIPIGNSSLQSSYAPSWKVLFLKGEISGSVDYMTGSHTTLNIPQISSSVIVKTTIENIEDYEKEKFKNNENDLIPVNDEEEKVYDDGSYINIEKDYLLLEIGEENSDFLNENFDIEVFKVETETNSKIGGSSGNIIEYLHPLYFRKNEKKNAALLQPKEKLEKETIDVDSTFIEYFFDVLVDNEIDKEDLCKVREDKTKNIFTDYTVECDIDKKREEEDIYKGLNTNFDEFKDCD